ncbi:tyrosine-type recombinase/integrase [Vibrio caribbeanicus]|uniref:tyrosine-type recombinase/integrase n=1 Tax=Vibrio caribbeanicus TaxID=701175 RepID=UPI0022853536|nr:site-specific integrase [Vibrio caribbeanicus]MCY9843802.1 tyrosine-type recombinase/integrase [Vibrio caribbeanicus]
MFSCISTPNDILTAPVTTPQNSAWQCLLEYWTMSLLTQKEITGLKAKDRAYYVWEQNRARGMGSLGVKVSPNKSKIFYFRYYINGQRKFIALGPFPILSLVDARELAKNYGLQVKSGLDPREEMEKESRAQEKVQREESQVGTLDQLFKAYTAQMKKEGKRTYQQVYEALVRNVFPLISKDTKAKNATTHDFRNVLAVMIRRGAVTQSNRVRSYLLAAYNYGLFHDNDPANFIDEAKFGITHNPIAAIPKQKYAERVGEHYLSHTEIHQLFHDLDQVFDRFRMGHSMRNLIQLCFYLGGQRPYEIISSRWDAIDWEQKTFLITADLSKNKKPHLVPLTDTALMILQRQQAQSPASDFIFPHRFENESMRTDSLSQSITRYRDATPLIRPFVARDIRRTCKTLMGELGISKELRDRLQNHALNDVSSKHYDRYEYLPEKRRALEAWEKKLNEIESDNVIMMRKF